MGTSYRKRKRLGPLPIWVNYSWSQTRGSHYSFSFKLGPWTYNTGRKTSTIDLPGGFKHTHRHGHAAKSKAAHPSRGKGGPGAAPAPAPYRPSWKLWVAWGVFLTLALIGGGGAGSVQAFFYLAVILAAVQLIRWYRHTGTPARRDTGEPAPAPEPAVDPAEAERIVRDWTPPADPRMRKRETS